MSDFTFSFRRLTEALLVPVVNTPTTDKALTIPDGFITKSMKAFAVYNPNVCVVSLRGTSQPAGQPKPTTPNLVRTTGVDWLFEPGFFGVFSTQNPVFMSACAFGTPRYPDVPTDANLVPLRVWYGMGA
jgi:hypothetical protein